ncbi:MAG: hypothetical protein ACOC55_03435 [Candidatus Natronoplasma sp.]
MILLGFWFLLLPPIVDYFILGEHGSEVGTQYCYLAMDELLPVLQSLILNPFERPGGVASTGQMVMFFAMIIGAFGYVALRNDLPGRLSALMDHGSKKISSFFASIGLTALTYHGLLITYWLIGSLQWIVRIGPESIVLFNRFSFLVEKKYYDFFYTHGYSEGEVFPPANVPRMGLLENLAYNQLNLLFGYVFLAVGALLLLISLYICYKETLKKMLKNMRVVDTSLFLAAGFVGIASLHLIDADFSQGWAVDPFYILHTQYVLFCLTALFFLSQFSFLVDDIYAYKRDDPRDNPLSNGDVPEYHYKQLASAYALSALFITFVLGWWTLILALIWIVASILLSSKSPSESTYTGMIKGSTLGSLAFLMGYYTPGSWVAFVLEHAEGEWIYASNETLLRTPSVSLETFLLFLWVMIGFALISLSSGTNTYFWSTISDKIADIKDNKLYLLFVIFVFFFPLLSHFSLLALIPVVSLAGGTVAWVYLLETKTVVKGGILILAVAFSLPLI